MTRKYKHRLLSRLGEELLIVAGALLGLAVILVGFMAWTI